MAKTLHSGAAKEGFAEPEQTDGRADDERR